MIFLPGFAFASDIPIPVPPEFRLPIQAQYDALMASTPDSHLYLGTLVSLSCQGGRKLPDGIEYSRQFLTIVFPRFTKEQQDKALAFIRATIQEQIAKFEAAMSENAINSGYQKLKKGQEKEKEKAAGRLPAPIEPIPSIEDYAEKERRDFGSLINDLRAIQGVYKDVSV